MGRYYFISCRGSVRTSARPKNHPHPKKSAPWANPLPPTQASSAPQRKGTPPARAKPWWAVCGRVTWTMWMFRCAGLMKQRATGKFLNKGVAPSFSGISVPYLLTNYRRKTSASSSCSTSLDRLILTHIWSWSSQVNIPKLTWIRVIILVRIYPSSRWRRWIVVSWHVLYWKKHEITLIYFRVKKYADARN